MPDEKFLNRINDLADLAWKKSGYVYTDFLTEAEQSDVRSAMKKLPVSCSLYGGYEDAERKIAVFGSEDEFGYTEDPPVSILKISPVSERYAEELGHRDYLGAVLNLGIDRRVTGDIIIVEKTAWIFVISHMAEYISGSLARVRHTDVCTRITNSLPKAAAAPPLEAYIYVPSLRADAFVSRVFRISRAEAQKYFAAERVFINSLLTVSSSHLIKEGDLVSVRGKGRFRYIGTTQQTKKGNLRVKISRY